MPERDLLQANGPFGLPALDVPAVLQKEHRCVATVSILLVNRCKLGTRGITRTYRDVDDPIDKRLADHVKQADAGERALARSDVLRHVEETRPYIISRPLSHVVSMCTCTCLQGSKAVKSMKETYVALEQ